MKKLSQQMLVLFVLMASSLAGSYAQGYTIKLTIKDLGNKEIYLGHFFADKTYVKDTVQTSPSGYAEFKGDKMLEPGIYFIVLPTKTIAWEFLMTTDDQDFEMKTDTSDYIGNLRVTGHDQNTKYVAFNAFMRDRTKEMSKYQEAIKADDEAKKEQVKKDIEALQLAVQAYWDKSISENPGTLFANIIRAQKYPEVPEFEVDPAIINKDSVLQIYRYYYSKNHWFDNIAFDDAGLLRTSFVYNKLQTFFTQMVLDPDTVIAEGDKIIKKAEPNPDMFRYLVEYMLNLNYETKRMGMDKVLVHVGEEYYLSGRASWVDSARLEKIKERVIKTRPNILGTQAKDMKMVTVDNKIINLFSIKADYIVVAFWEPGCGHCKKTIPVLHDIYTDLKWNKNKSIEVMAIFTQVKEFDEWQSFLEEKGMTDWINA
ncbi:MAG: DUF5106 domain-containing protein, partial [Bacteroidales bacterium]|nr:DUF5106 domain-containing protein [Bacteroidales bacterium]